MSNINLVEFFTYLKAYADQLPKTQTVFVNQRPGREGSLSAGEISHACAELLVAFPAAPEPVPMLGEATGIRIEGVNDTKRCFQIVTFEEIERASVKDPFEWYKEFLDRRYGGPFKFHYKIERSAPAVSQEQGAHDAGR